MSSVDVSPAPRRASHDSATASSTAANIDSTSASSPVLQALACPALLTILGVAALAIDVPLARWFEEGNFPDALKKLCNLAEVFGHGTGAAMIFVSAWVLAPERRSGLPRAISATFIAGMLANGLKMMVSRRRPYRFDLDKSVLLSFRGWFPLLSAGTGGQGFPSGHTATAVALAMGLTWLCPRGKWLFTTLAVLAALQRLVTSYHFLSDTLWGAAVGWLCASACLPGGWFASRFDRLEAHLQSSRA